jgi:S1-C subfamily serine protease
MRRSGLAVLLLVGGFLLGRWLSWPTSELAQADDQTALRQGLSGLTAEEHRNVAVYEQANRGVVNISTRIARSDSFFLSVSVAEGSGSGSVLDRRGRILTNLHVVEGARDIHVTLFNNERFEARLLGADPENDIAVLQIDAPAEMLHPISLGDSASLRVGQKIFAIGNPFGLERTMSTGIISSLNRQIPARSRRTIKSIIQIDAALNQGNSGGPLLDSQAALIGMNTAIATSTGDNAGIGFAIPANTIRRVVPQLIQNGRVVRPTIGITRVYESGRGLVVINVTPDGPAERAGIRGLPTNRRSIYRGGLRWRDDERSVESADVIVSVDGQTVRSADDLLSVIELKSAGEAVMLQVDRAGQNLPIQVVLGAGD